jgi:hypothetical protein
VEIGATTAFNDRSYSTTNVGEINDGCASLTSAINALDKKMGKRLNDGSHQ